MTWYVGLEGFWEGGGGVWVLESEGGVWVLEGGGGAWVLESGGVWCRRVELMSVHITDTSLPHSHTPPPFYTLVWEGGAGA